MLARTGPDGTLELVGFVVGKAGAPLTAEGLRQHLKLALPEYMVPAKWMFLERLPLTPIGKLDRKSLPAPAPPAATASINAATGAARLLEAGLLRLWSVLFDRSDLTANSNFFEIGGHSLLATRLVSEIEKLVGRRIPVATIFQAPTVSELARVLSDRNWAPPWGALVPLRPAGARPPLFFVHGWGGDVIVFTELARKLGHDQPSYGLQAATRDGGVPRHRSVEEMASCYVEELMSLRSGGPYFLCGYSFGGIIAFEIARQLTARGQQVGLLTMLDTYPRSLPWPVFLEFHLPRLAQRAQVHAKWLLTPGHSGRLDYMRARLRDGWRNLRKTLQPSAGTQAISQPSPAASPLNDDDYYVTLVNHYLLRQSDFHILLFLAADAAPVLVPTWRWASRGRPASAPGTTGGVAQLCRRCDSTCALERGE